MPRLARLDAPGVLHHVIGRGIERRKIFYNDKDRRDFVDRLVKLGAAGAWAVYAWVLMPNHYHLFAQAWGTLVQKVLDGRDGLCEAGIMPRLGRLEGLGVLLGQMEEGRWKQLQ